MNTITRELIERELEEAQAELNTLCHSIEARKTMIRRDEEHRDELANKVGALKETLGRSEDTPWEDLAAELGRGRLTRRPA